MANRIKVLGNRLEKIDNTNYKIENDGAGSARLVLVLDLNNIKEVMIEAGTVKNSPPQAFSVQKYVLTRVKTGEIKTSTTPVIIAKTLANFKNGETFFIDVFFESNVNFVKWAFTFGTGIADAYLEIDCKLSYTYNNVQFIGYNINTGSIKNPLTGKYSYPGIPGTDHGGRKLCPQDLEARCHLMEDAIMTAALKANKDPETLKVFMAPEFFFRGPYGAYEMEDVASIISKLKEIANKTMFRDWLFFFGSIVGVSYQTKKVNEIEVIDTSKTKEVYNICLAQKGNISGSEGTWAIVKEYKSTIDFTKSFKLTDGFADEDVRHMSLYKPTVTARSETSIYNYSGLSLFRSDSINFSVDICLDHLTKRSVKSSATPDGEEIQIQLVPSYGMTLKENSIIAETGGYAFNVDGRKGYTSELKQVTGPNKLANVPQVPSVTEKVTVTPFSPPWSPPFKVSQIFDSSTGGTVDIYSPLSTPPNQKDTSIYKNKVISIHADAIKFHIQLQYDASGKYLAAFSKVEIVSTGLISELTNITNDITWINYEENLKVKYSINNITVDGNKEISVKVEHPDANFQGGILKFYTSIPVV